MKKEAITEKYVKDGGGSVIKYKSSIYTRKKTTKKRWNHIKWQLHAKIILSYAFQCNTCAMYKHKNQEKKKKTMKKVDTLSSIEQRESWVKDQLTYQNIMLKSPVLK